MAKKPKLVDWYDRRCCIEVAIRDLQRVRDHLAKLEVPPRLLLIKVRSALKSADGARRHAEGMVNRSVNTGGAL